MRTRRSGGTNRRFVGENPPDGCQIFYSLAKDANEVTLKIESAGETIRELEAKKEAGLHRVVWDLRRQARQGQRGGQQGRFRRFFRAPRIRPGTYQVVLEVDGKVHRENLSVVIDPEFQDGTFLEYEELEELFFPTDEESEGAVPNEVRREVF